MKAIGKGSLASILAMILHIVRAVTWVALGGVIIGMVLVPFLPTLILWLNSLHNVNVEHDFSGDIGDLLDAASTLVSLILVIYVANRLLEILKTLRFGSPFVKENADRFVHIGLALLLAETAKIVFSILSAIFDADISLEFEMMNWFAIAIVFVLAAVFREGARMKEDQDLTV